MRMLKTAVVTALVTGLAGAACDGLGIASYRPQDRFFAVVVTRDDGGQCRVQAVTPPTGGFAVQGDTVYWDMVGSCPDTEIGVRDFTLDGRVPPSPLWDGDDARRTARPGGRARDTVRKGATEGTYKYSIYLDGRLALDPEIQIKGRP